MLAPGLRRPARPPAHARAARTRRPSSRGRPPPRRAATARSWPCRTPTRSSTRRRFCARSRRAPAEQAEIPVGFLAAISKGSEGGQPERDGRACRLRRRRLLRRRPAGRGGRADAPRTAVRRDHGPAAGAPLRGAEPLPRRADARGRRLGRARLRGLSLARRERHGRARPLDRRLRGSSRSTCSTSRRGSRSRRSPARRPPGCPSAER